MISADPLNLNKLFPGNSEMARRMREFDWSKSPLGPVKKWPQSLLTTIRLMINSRYPMFVWWGRELTIFYNDSHIPILGERHPEALGQPAPRVWAEIWDVIGPQAESVMRDGLATWNESILLVMERHGYSEETYFTFSYSPVTDDDGNVGGVCCACTEDTKRILAERRVRTLRALADRATQAKSAEEACAIAATTMRVNPYDLPFALLYLLEEDGAKARLVGATTRDAPANPAVIELGGDANGAWPLGQAFESGESRIVNDLEARFGLGMRVPGGAWPEPARQAIVLPMARPGQEQPSGFLIVGVSPRLKLDDDYRAFLELTAGHVASAIANARAHEQERRRVEDITERKEAENAKARLAAIVESSDDAIISKDLNGIITSWNLGAERLFGYTAQEAVDRPISMLIPPDRLDEEPSILARIRRGERIDHYETVRRCKDGTLLDISLSISPIVGAHGQIVGASKIARNITERKRADDALRASEERFRLMADSSPIMIWMTDAQGSTSFLNRTYLEYFGIAAEEAVKFDWPEVVHPEDRDGYVEAFKAALRNRETFHQRARLRRFDGQWRWFEARGVPILNVSGKLLAYICSSPDITEIYESQQTLKELGQRKDEFLANMSHEIRSPLTSIMGYADILLTRLIDPEEIECLRTIKESGNYLVEIINDILDLSKIEAGKLVLNIEAVSVRSVLAEVQALMDLRAKQKSLPLALRYDGVLPETIQTDRTRLRQILINLVSNAIKFTEHGRVDIVSKYLPDQQLLQIEVIDTGIGIAREDQESLFQPFTQADSTSARRYGGTGLGLTITRRLVEMLSGNVSFESALNKGSTFRVTIPTEPAQHTSKPADLASDTQALEEVMPLANRHILVVDDRKEICDLVSRYIRIAGGRPSSVSDGKAAVEAVLGAAASDRFDAILLDIHIPGMDGYEVTRTLRAKGFQTPIIALTAGAMVGEREKCLRAGCDDFLTKPIDQRALVQIVARLAQNGGHAYGSGNKRRVLLVDDSHAACKLLSHSLGKSGHNVRSAFDGESAIAIAQEFCPDVFLIDIRLPDMNGYELMQRLKQLNGSSRARFIAVSGYRAADDPASREFDYFLEKPLDMAHIESLLSSL